MTSFTGFPPDTLEFLHDLEENNRRDWFQANKRRYEQSLVEPALDLIAAVHTPMQKIAPMLEVTAKKVGGSLMRIYRDTRFSKDKTPYKTNIGIQFRHLAGKDVHAPGVYVHIATDESFIAAGMWRPDSVALREVRNAILDDSSAWRKATEGKRFKETYQLYDDRLKTAPRGIAGDHPAIADLRLKSFMGVSPLGVNQLASPELVQVICDAVRRAAPVMRFLCQAVGQPY